MCLMSRKGRGVQAGLHGSDEKVPGREINRMHIQASENEKSNEVNECRS